MASIWGGRGAFAVCSVSLIFAMCGCASQPPAQGGLVQYPDVDQNDYRAAFETFENCMDEAGYPVLVRDDSKTVIEYSVAGTAVDNGVEATCYEDFELIDQAWQIKNEDTSIGALKIRRCLEENGIVPVGTAIGDWDLVLKNGLEEIC